MEKMEVEGLLDKVIYIKNRVWTIYATTNNGVFCYQGIKPYPSFKYDSTQMTLNISYFDLEDVAVSFIEGSKIEWYMEKMKSSDKKKLTKQHAVDFYVHLTGQSKSFVTKYMEERDHALSLTTGAIRFDLWKSDGALLLSHNIHGTTHLAYFDFLTFESHSQLNDRSTDAYKQEIIDSYKDWQGIVE
jgi:hypothetical protein